MSISPDLVQKIHDRPSFLGFLANTLGWPIGDVDFQDLTYEWLTDDLKIDTKDLRGSELSQLRPFAEHQPWGIFFLHLKSERLYVTELRRIIRALAPMKRKHKDYPTWNPRHLLFICTPDWKNYTFAHFEGDEPQSAKLSTFGWEYQSSYVRTLCEFNIPELRYPEERDMFGLDPEAWIKLWSSAFDVKKVTDNFYAEYDKIFKDIKRELAPKFNLPKKTYDKKYDEWSDKERKADEPLHIFVQNLVNRLMFLKFLEKRKWLDFNPNYLRDLHQAAKKEKKNFYKDYLYYVFFAGLNRQVDLLLLDQGRVHTQAQIWQERIGILPFLNGGLFEKEHIDETIDIPDSCFDELFDLFGRYNFTVNEDTPLDVEVAVNPEMLGKVFEKSVIGRKEKGAYYTPRNIVSFMSREALKNHLECRTQIGGAHEKIQRLVDSHSAELLAPQDALELYKALHNIKVLDPAVGSGAFPMGMMHELVEVYKAIGEKLEHDHPYLVQNRLANPKDVYKLKKQIIQNSLYGVDIEAFAINIARLRFWLSLAVDFPIDFSTREEFIERVHQIEPLPNLLYKLRCGDSLLANYHGVSLEPHSRDATGQYNADRRKRIEDMVTGVAKLKLEFYPERDSSRKKKLQGEIETKMKSLVVREIEFDIDALRKESGQHGLFELTKAEKAEKEETEREIERLEEVKSDLQKSEGLPDDFPVIWDVEFGEVLSEGGFDVIIANPPYVRQEELKEIKDDLKLHYDCFAGTADLYTYFYEKGIKLLKPGGAISFISSNKFFRAGYGEKLRTFLTANTAIHTLIDFGDLPVFEATTYPCVLIAARNAHPPVLRHDGTGSTPSPKAGGGDALTFRARTVASLEELGRFEEVFRAEAITMKQSDLSHEGWRIEDRNVLDLLAKIKKAGVPLEEYVGGKIFYGIKTGFNDAFVIDETTKIRLIKEDKKSAEVIKPFLRGRDIKRYAIEDPGLWLIYVPHKWTNGNNKKKKDAEEFFESELPTIHSHLKQFEKELKKRDDQGDYWWEMRPCKYLEEFEKPKIISAVLMIEPLFAYDDGGHYTLDTCYILPEATPYTSAILNCKLGWWLLRKLTNQVQNEYSKIQISQLSRLPIAKPTNVQREYIEARVEKILAAKKKNPSADTSALEREIDLIVYHLYNLTYEEAKIIDPELSGEEFEKGKIV